MINLLIHIIFSGVIDVEKGFIWKERLTKHTLTHKINDGTLTAFTEKIYRDAHYYMAHF